MPIVLFFHYGGRTELLDLLAGLTPLVEPDGEAVFAEMGTRSLPDFLTGAGLAGFQLSLGAGANPLVARAALDAGRYGGGHGALTRYRTAGGLVARVPAGAEAAFMADLPVEALWPLPARTIKGLRGLGLVTAGDVARVGGRELRARFGPEGVLIRAYSRGRDHRRVRALYPPPGVVWTRDLGRVSDRGGLEYALAAGAGRVAAGLRAQGRGYRRLVLSLGLDDGRTVETAGDYTGGAPDSSQVRTRLGLLLDALAVQAPVTGVQVRAGKLYRLQSRQIDLFSMTRPGEETLRHLLGAVNLKYPGKLMRGYTGEAARFRRERMRGVFG